MAVGGEREAAVLRGDAAVIQLLVTIARRRGGALVGRHSAKWNAFVVEEANVAVRAGRAQKLTVRVGRAVAEGRDIAVHLVSLSVHWSGDVSHADPIETAPKSAAAAHITM